MEHDGRRTRVATETWIRVVLLLSGPAPLRPAPQPGHRRLTGVWAFVIVLLLSNVW